MNQISATSRLHFWAERASLDPMRSTLACCCLLVTFGCAHKQSGSGTESGSPKVIGEREGAGIDAEQCAHYLAGTEPLEQQEFMPVSEEVVQAAMATAGGAAPPRCAHYELAHMVMVIALFEDPRVGEVLWEREDSEILLDSFADLANEVCGEDDPNAWQMPAPGFTIGRTELLGRPVVMVDVIAPPIATTEAHMFAIVGHPWPEGGDRRLWTGFDRYFVLEYSVFFEPTHTVTGGWVRADGRNTHLNMGGGPIPTPSAFLHDIGKNLCGNFVGAMTEL